ncbi:MAG TPA: hypothetical protein VGN24_02170 [Rhodanobacter sp.]|jgi:hypothetical protein|nr:hypothetical protein [Rhodanobacter sp.]
MQILIPLFVAMRARQLGRQFRDIERSIQALPKASRDRLGMLTLREIAQAARCDFPHLYGTAPESRYLPWGQGTGIGYERARSNTTEAALRGMALWLAVAYHETRDATHAGLQLQHRQLLHLLRELKDVDDGTGSVDGWPTESAVA